MFILAHLAKKIKISDDFIGKLKKSAKISILKGLSTLVSKKVLKKCGITFFEALEGEKNVIPCFVFIVFVQKRRRKKTVSLRPKKRAIVKTVYRNPGALAHDFFLQERSSPTSSSEYGWI